MWLRRISAVAVALVVSLTYAESARSDESGAIAGAAVAAAVGAIVCSSVVMGVPEPDDVSEFDRRGWFVNAAGTFAVEKFESSIRDEVSSRAGAPVTVDTDDSLGVNGGAGYRCHRYFSTEMELEWIEGFDTDLSQTGVGAIGSLDPDPKTITTNFKGYLPYGRFQPYALAGFGIMFATISANDVSGSGLITTEEFRSFAVRLGGGVDFYATEHIVLNIGAEQVIPTGRGKDLDYISVGWGIQYRF
jgi:opacity protein-like surface antigen